MRYRERHWRVNSNPETVQHVAERKAAIEWAQELVMHDKRIAVLDTETTGLLMASFFGERPASATQWAGSEVCEVAAIDGQGNTLVNTLLRIQEPEGMDLDAFAVHGISPIELAGPAARYFPEVWHECLLSLLTEYIIVGYNILFDLQMIQQTARRYPELAPFPERQVFQPAHDLQQQYAQFRGNPPTEKGKLRGDRYRLYPLEAPAGYFHIPLPPIRHRALDDCRLTLAVLQALAQEKY